MSEDDFNDGATGQGDMCVGAIGTTTSSPTEGAQWILGDVFLVRLFTLPLSDLARSLTMAWCRKTSIPCTGTHLLPLVLPLWPPGLIPRLVEQSLLLAGRSQLASLSRAVPPEQNPLEEAPLLVRRTGLLKLARSAVELSVVLQC